MPSHPIPVFLDTSAIRTAGFGHPDFRRLLEFSKSNVVRLFVSYIAWEELRTQLLETAYADVLKLQQQFDGLSRGQPDSFILQGLRVPMMDLWNKIELEAGSQEAMDKFASDNRITVITIGADHSSRAWRRYFDVSLPFRPEVTKRENRRKDIPDSWILEAAIDVQRDYPGLIATCHDGNLRTALTKVLEIPVYETIEAVVEFIDGTLEAPKAVEPAAPSESVPATRSEEPFQAEGALAAVFLDAEAQLRSVGTKVIGFVSYLGSPTKDQLFNLLERSGVPIAAGRNVAEQLALAKVIQDTGHHYIPGNKEAGAQAASSIEPEIIRLISGEV